jgi:hypothetical protein
VSALEAAALQRALHALGDYAHVAVRAGRGHLPYFDRPHFSGGIRGSEH